LAIRASEENDLLRYPQSLRLIRRAGTIPFRLIGKPK
jgi:hypothetical protein